MDGGLIVVIALIYAVATFMSKDKTAKTKKFVKDSMPMQHPYKTNQAQNSMPTVIVIKEKAQEAGDDFVSAENQPIFQHARQEMTSRLEPVFHGSIDEMTYEGMASSEGFDPCHDDMEVQRHSYESQVPQTGVSGLNLAFTKDSMLQAIVMSEVLTRPCDRKRRGIR